MSNGSEISSTPGGESVFSRSVTSPPKTAGQCQAGDRVSIGGREAVVSSIPKNKDKGRVIVIFLEGESASLRNMSFVDAGQPVEFVGRFVRCG